MMTSEYGIQYWIYRYRSAITFFLAICLIVLLQWPRSESVSPGDLTPAIHTTQPELDYGPSSFGSLEKAAYAPVPEIHSGLALSDRQTARLSSGDSDGVRADLLSDSMQAVVEDNQQQLAESLARVGLVALEEWETDTALVYLAEALAVFEELDDSIGIANVKLQIGRAHIIERRKARRAALAHDATLLAHWYIANNRFDDAYPALQKAVDENLSLRRHGAAARGFETMYRGFRERGEMSRAISAAKEAALLHASAGRLDAATSLLDRLIDDGVSYSEIESARSSLNQLNAEYDESVQQIGRARDYDRLYNHYINEGDPVSAWRFRLEANSVLSQASKRARYRRQSGVLVLLYDSNDSMEKARDALNDAATIYQSMSPAGSSTSGDTTRTSADNLAQQAAQLLQEIY